MRGISLPDLSKASFLGFLHLQTVLCIPIASSSSFVMGEGMSPYAAEESCHPKVISEPWISCIQAFLRPAQICHQHRLFLAFASLYQVLLLMTKRALTDRNIAVLCVLSPAGNSKRELCWLVLPVPFGLASTALNAFCRWSH